MVNMILTVVGVFAVSGTQVECLEQSRAAFHSSPLFNLIGYLFLHADLYFGQDIGNADACAAISIDWIHLVSAVV
jgi:hypothetical protein